MDSSLWISSCFLNLLIKASALSLMSIDGFFSNWSTFLISLFSTAWLVNASFWSRSWCSFWTVRLWQGGMESMELFFIVLFFSKTTLNYFLLWSCSPSCLRIYKAKKVTLFYFILYYIFVVFIYNWGGNARAAS